MQTKQQTEQLEHMQEEVAVEEPVWMYLKSERVQEPAQLSGAQAEGNASRVYELAFSHQQPMTIELAEPQIFIHVYESTRGSRAKA
jgi:hypothetical protein